MRVAGMSYLLLGVLALLLPWIGLYPLFLMKLLCFAMFACAYNLLLGYGRMLSFGHAAFFGFPAYVASWLITAHGAGPAGAVLSGMTVAAVLGVIFGGLAIRRRGIYFAMITLALGQLVYFVCLESPFTGGENGLQGVPRGTLLGLLPLRSDRVMYYLVLAIFVAVFLFIRRVVHSPFGHVLRAIRENEARAISLGYDINRYKLMAFVLSATLSGVAGATNALVFQLAALNSVHWSMSGEVVLMNLVGGLGTIFGPVVGAFVVLAMENYLASLGFWVTIVQGAIFVLCVLAFRRGIVGELGRLIRKPL